MEDDVDIIYNSITGRSPGDPKTDLEFHPLTLIRIQCAQCVTKIPLHPERVKWNTRTPESKPSQMANRNNMEALSLSPNSRIQVERTEKNPMMIDIRSKGTNIYEPHSHTPR